MTPPTRQDRGPTLAALLAIVIIAAAITLLLCYSIQGALP